MVSVTNLQMDQEKKTENATAKMGKILRKTQGGNSDLCCENKVLYLLSLGDKSI